MERKKPDIAFDWVLSDQSDPQWERDLDQVLVRGNRFITETAFFHRSTRTLILVDLIEYVTDVTPAIDWKLKLWWKMVFHMWNRPKPTPEYQLGWNNKRVATTCLKRIME